jgi:hypothetical protein
MAGARASLQDTCSVGAGGVELKRCFTPALASEAISRMAITLVAACACVAGCGGDSKAAGAEPKEWATEVCNLIVQTAGEAQAVFADAQTEFESGPFEPRRLRRSLVRGMSEALRVQGGAIARLDAIGPPAVEDGEAVQPAFRAPIVRLREATSEARGRLRTMPIDTSEHLFAALEVFVADYREAVGAAFELPPDLEAESGHRELALAWEATACSSP